MLPVKLQNLYRISKCKHISKLDNEINHFENKLAGFFLQTINYRKYEKIHCTMNSYQ